jgi:hypothetical protein
VVAVAEHPRAGDLGALTAGGLQPGPLGEDGVQRLLGLVLGGRGRVDPAVVLGLAALPDQALREVVLPGVAAGQLLGGGGDAGAGVLGGPGHQDGVQRDQLGLHRAEPDGERRDVGEVAGPLPLAGVVVPGQQVLQHRGGVRAHAQRQPGAAVRAGGQPQPEPGGPVDRQRPVAHVPRPGHPGPPPQLLDIRADTTARTSGTGDAA